MANVRFEIVFLHLIKKLVSLRFTKINEDSQRF